MKFDKKHLAEAFSRHSFEKTYPYLAEDITWDLISGEVLKGKEAVVKTCEESATYLAQVKTTFKKFKSFSSEDAIIIDSLAEYVDAEKKVSIVASCDIYEFTGEKLSKITSYTIEIPS